MKFFFFSCNYLNSSEVVLSTVCEINEKSPSTPSSCCAVVTGPPPSRPTNFKNRLVKQETRQEIEDDPELVDSCALKPLLGHGPGMEPSDPLLDDQYHQALIHRRRFGRQRGSISLDGRVYWIIHLIKLPYNSINLVYSLLPCDHTDSRFLNVSWLKKMKVMKFVFVGAESVLITSRLNAPLIQIIADGSPSSPMDPSGEGRTNCDEDEEQRKEAAGQLNNSVLVSSGGGQLQQRRLFYTNESSRSYMTCGPVALPPSSASRNSLPRVSLTSLGRHFTPRSSWNGSKAALLQLQRKTSRADANLGGVPGYLAKKYHLTNRSDSNAKDQVIFFK